MASDVPCSSNAAEQIVSDDDEIDYSVKPEFYDPCSDDRDEAWLERRRKGRKSDALLTCPACFTTLCVDCQRHEKYVTQYRAMFVLNCKIVDNQRLRLPADCKRKRSDGKKSRGQCIRKSDYLPETTSKNFKDEVFKPVCCSVCQTEVAVLDEDDVYHFFNVMPSYA